ncbi:MAG TPA: peptide deformylase [Thermohalobaculum sp.]|nr:peptide deformylase [Thermohalobaculum sp.]
MLRPILIHPDPRLKRPADPVVQVDAEVRGLMDDMLATMYAAPGIGLAAPQLGIGRRIVVMDCATREDVPPEPVFLVNPELLWTSEEQVEQEEGCLSIPDIYGPVTRPAAVRVRYLDRDGEVQERDWDGIRARCVQHEIDHLKGRLFIDYLSPMRRQLITGKMKKLKRERARKAAERQTAEG